MENQLEKYTRLIKDAQAFIKYTVEDASADGVIFGLSGGIDSAVVAHLCAKIYPKNSLAVIMPNDDFTPSSETDDGLLVAKKLGIEYEVVPIKDISDSYEPDDKKIIRGNLNARIRANILYMKAAQKNYLVCGTSDKSEFMIGYFTKYGDSASDFMPIVNLYKTEVQEMAKYLDVPQHIIEKKPGAHLYKNHNAFEELGLTYDTIDEELRKGGLKHLRKHALHKQMMPKRIFNRPWGWFEPLKKDERNEKILHINPHQQTSLQSHKYRNEAWTILSGNCMITHGDKECLKEPGDKIYVPVNVKHRIRAMDQEVVIHEVWGESSEEDITRYEDIYGRK